MSEKRRQNLVFDRRPRFAVAAALALVAFISAFPDGLRVAEACDNTVRGQAFVEPRDIHRLCVIAKGDDPSSAAILERLENWLAGPGAELSLELVPLDAGDERIEWEAYGIPSAPPVLPVTVLVGRSSRDYQSFVIDHWEPAPAAEDLAVLKSSPAREAIREQTLRHWAVLLYSPGAGPTSEEREAVIQAVAAAWAEEHPPGVAVVRLDRNDPRERTLLSFAGLAPDAPDWVAVAFGRGKLMAPPLVGDEITESNIEELLGKLIEICSCLQPPGLLGVDMPLAWAPELDETAVSLAPPGTTATAALAAVAGERPEGPASGNGILKTVLAAMGLAALLVAGATAAIVRRSRPPRDERA